MLLPDPDGTVHGDLDPDRVRALCDRRAGIGGDGVLRAVRDDDALVHGLPQRRRLDAARCAATASASSPATSTTTRARRPGSTIDTRDGVKIVDDAGDGLLTVDMGTPAGARRRRPSASTALAHAARHVSTGNPHAVAFVDDARPRPARCSTEPGYDPTVYPDGVNVEFVVRRGAHHVAMRVHERGLRRDPVLRHRRVRGDGRHRAGRRAHRAATAYRVDVPGGSLDDRVDRGRPGADDRARGPGGRGHDRPLRVEC